MPELARFLGIIIRIYVEPGTPHHQPHFPAYYQNHSAVYDIDSLEVMGGSLPRRQQRFVEAWAEIHQGELKENWERLQSGQIPYKIAPLK